MGAHLLSGAIHDEQDDAHDLVGALHDKQDDAHDLVGDQNQYQGDQDINIENAFVNAVDGVDKGARAKHKKSDNHRASLHVQVKTNQHCSFNSV